jgi:hypothetical protein
VHTAQRALGAARGPCDSDGVPRGVSRDSDGVPRGVSRDSDGVSRGVSRDSDGVSRVSWALPCRRAAVDHSPVVGHGWRGTRAGLCRGRGRERESERERKREVLCDSDGVSRDPDPRCRGRWLGRWRIESQIVDSDI